MPAGSITRISRIHRQTAAQPVLGSSSLLRLAFRIRVQLGGAVVVCVLLPAIIRDGSWQRSFEYPLHSSLGYAAAGTFFALSLGYMLLRQFVNFPGVRATNYILPSFTVSYAAVALVFFFGRMDYSRWQFASSFILAIVWFFSLYSLTRRYARPRLALLPSENAGKITCLKGASWIDLQTPPENLADIDGVVANLRASFAPEWERFLARTVLQGWPVYDVKQIQESLTGRVEIEHLSENSFGSVLPSLIYLRLKRIIDVITAAMVLPVFIPIILVAAAAIRLESKGPVLFRQLRMGFRANPFTCYKLRSMRQDKMGAKFTADDDPRITRVGRFLRKYRIDEFPQIFNILKGEMSWIGPRPEAVELALWYERDIPFYNYRHAVRPGITGWAQVNLGNVAEVKAATAKLHYDFYYIKYFSLWLDLLIVAKTIRTMLTGFGAR
jgi:lipopolysaccharide/colanic/teichoic acid biosynthesis glycosyltransferase